METHQSVNVNFNIPLSRWSFPHFTVPSLNATLVTNDNGELVRDYVYEYTPLPYTSNFCEPFIHPAFLSEQNLRGQDPSTELINEKKLWELHRDELVSRSVKSKKNSVLNTKYKKVKKVSKWTVELVEHLSKNPDSNFSGFYNWYYSGGCLNKFSYFSGHSLLHTRNSNPGRIEIIPLHIIESDCIPVKDHSVILRTGRKQPIFQICTDNNFIAARQKNCTSLFKLIDSEQFKFEKVHKHLEEKDSIVSVAISNDLTSDYATLTSSHKLKLWSPSVKTDCIRKAKVKRSCQETCDHWGDIKYVSENYILVSTRSCVYLKDTRIKLGKKVQKWKPKLNNSCDLISMAVVSSCQENNVFIGTNHNLYELDLRQGFSKQWTHMMEFPPMYGATFPVLDCNEMLVMGSQNINEVCLIDTNLHVMPFMLPSPDETLYKVNQNGNCLDPNVSCRFNFGMGGVTTLYDDKCNCIFVFRNTVVGDMFYQKLVPTTETHNSDINYKYLLKWEEKCYKSFEKYPSTPFNITDEIDFSKIFNAKKTQLKKVKRFNRSQCKINSKFTQKPTWRISKGKLLNAEGNLSHALLAQWNVDELDEWKDKLLINKETELINETPIIETCVDNATVIEKEFYRNEISDNIIYDRNNKSSSELAGLPIKNTTTVISSLNPDSRLCSNISNHDKSNLNYEEFVDTSDNALLYSNSSNFFTPTTVKKNVKPTPKSKSRFSSGF